MDRFEPTRLRDVAAQLLETTDARSEIVDTVSESLIQSDLRGHHSHGLVTIPGYFDWIDEGLIEPEAEGAISEETHSHILIDGQNGFGHYTGKAATELAIEKVEEHPFVTVGIRRGSHFGRVGWFAEHAAKSGLGFIGFTNMTSGRPVAPAGSAQRRFGTNPVTLAIPSFDAKDHPILLDMATSQVAYGKLLVNSITDDPVDPSWTATREGEPVDSADAFVNESSGSLLPLGGVDAGYKGTALMLMTELFASLFSNSPVTGQDDVVAGNAGFFLVFDPLAYTSRASLEAKIRALEQYLAETEYSDAVSSGAGTPFDGALLPGTAEHRIRTENRERGIPLHDSVQTFLSDAAFERGITIDVPDTWSV